jgi:hypothetical protein
MEEKFQTESRCRIRGRGETLRKLAHDIRRLMMMAYPGERSKLSEHMARDAFLSALDDQELELRVREREPATVEAAVKIAQRFEVFRSAVEASSSERHRINRQVAEASMTSGGGEHLQPRVERLEQELRRLDGRQTWAGMGLRIANSPHRRELNRKRFGQSPTLNNPSGKRRS